jgi:two-component system LytT family response regulator
MMIVAVRNYSMVHLKNGEKILSSKTLKYWQDTINDPVNLLRIHRSYLIHRSVILYFNSIKGSFNLVNGMEIMGSRRHVKILKDKM